MSAHYPARPDYTAADREQDILPPVEIDGDDNTITIGDVTLLGTWIQANGVSLQPGGDDAVNTLTVTFIVGDVDITDSALAQVTVGGNEAGRRGVQLTGPVTQGV